MVSGSPAARVQRTTVRGLLSGLLLLALIATGGPVPAADTVADAGQFLITFGQQAAVELNDSTLTESERDRRFRALFNQAVDVSAIGRFILGTHWRRATAREQADFLAVFEDIAVQRFLPIFTRRTDDYRGKSFEIVEVLQDESRGGHIFVTARLERDKAPPVSLVWRMREEDGGYKILDVSAEGLSMILTLRQEYSSAIRRSGSVAGLVTLLREKVAAGAFAPRTAASESQ